MELECKQMQNNNLICISCTFADSCKRWLYLCRQGCPMNWGRSGIGIWVWIWIWFWVCARSKYSLDPATFQIQFVLIIRPEIGREFAAPWRLSIPLNARSSLNLRALSLSRDVEVAHKSISVKLTFGPLCGRRPTCLVRIMRNCVLFSAFGFGFGLFARAIKWLRGPGGEWMGSGRGRKGLVS